MRGVTVPAALLLLVGCTAVQAPLRQDAPPEAVNTPPPSAAVIPLPSPAPRSNNAQAAADSPPPPVPPVVSPARRSSPVDAPPDPPAPRPVDQQAKQDTGEPFISWPHRKPPAPLTASPPPSAPSWLDWLTGHGTASADAPPPKRPRLPVISD